MGSQRRLLSTWGFGVGWLVRAGLLPWFQAAIKGRACSTPGDLWTCRPAGDSYRPLLGKGFCPLSASVTGLCVSCDGFHRGEIPVLSSVQGRRLIIQSSQGCSRSKCSSSRTSSLARGWTKSVVLAVALLSAQFCFNVYFILNFSD